MTRILKKNTAQIALFIKLLPTAKQVPTSRGFTVKSAEKHLFGQINFQPKNSA